MVPGRSLDENGAHSARAGQSISTFAELYQEKDITGTNDPEYSKEQKS